jgi:hypothetical protein
MDLAGVRFLVDGLGRGGGLVVGESDESDDIVVMNIDESDVDGEE